MTITHTRGALRPTAGALRLAEARTTNPASVDVMGYTAAVMAHCPYLAPSVARELTGWTVYEAAGDPAAVEAEVFHAGVQAAEWVRPFTSRPYGPFVCENIVIVGAGADVMQWPHWALKHLYGPVGLMVGKFAAGEQRTDRRGVRIPAPPVSFMPVRTAIKPRDPRFLAATPHLADALKTAMDDGRNAFEEMPKEWGEIRQWAQRLLTRP
ncbi:hypothetical protein [Streptomyces puniciscabiei]|uniref:hypothetical protein n=1 Tax=Streptomyces puniciscabiei TaxID=164348 RepID=UPI0033269D8E